MNNSLNKITYKNYLRSFSSSFNIKFAIFSFSFLLDRLHLYGAIFMFLVESLKYHIFICIQLIVISIFKYPEKRFPFMWYLLSDRFEIDLVNGRIQWAIHPAVGEEILQRHQGQEEITSIIWECRFGWRFLRILWYNRVRCISCWQTLWVPIKGKNVLKLER